MPCLWRETKAARTCNSVKFSSSTGKRRERGRERDSFRSFQLIVAHPPSALLSLSLSPPEGRPLGRRQLLRDSCRRMGKTFVPVCVRLCVCVCVSSCVVSTISIGFHPISISAFNCRSCKSINSPFQHSIVSLSVSLSLLGEPAKRFAWCLFCQSPLI